MRRALALLALALPGAAEAAACCTATGVEPLSLSSCEKLAIIASTDLGVETGAFGWDGGWWPPAGDGGATGAMSIGFMGRLRPWLVGGLRLPLTAAIDRLDHDDTFTWGLGHPYPWARAEVVLPHGVSAGWTLALGTVGPNGGAVVAGAKTIETGPSLMLYGADGFASARILAAVPFVGDASTDVRGEVTGGRSLGHGTMLGGRVEGYVALPDEGWKMRSTQLRLGPAVWLTPRRDQRLEISLVVGPPLKGFGRSAPSTAGLAVTWLAAG